MRSALLIVLMACGGDKTSSEGAGDTADSDSDSDSGAPDSHCAVDRWDAAAFATVIDVGAAHDVATPSGVPWEALEAGTLVRIWLDGSPYHDKWAIDAAGTEEQPIVVIGVCDPETGEIPVIDGEDAVSRTELDFWNENGGVVKVGGTSNREDIAPAWVYVEDLEIRGGRSGHAFTDDAGNASTYVDNAAAFYVEEGEHVTVRGCTLTDSGNGIFASSDTRDFVVSANHVYGNGNVGSSYEHNSYTEALGITFQFNRYGPLCGGCGGNNLKDRSAGTVIRYNWIEGGNRQLDLVDADDPALLADPSYRETFVYGNVLIEHDGEDNSQILHYGGDGADSGNYRRGTLYFYANTVVSERPGNTTLARLSDDDEIIDVRGSVLYAAGTIGILATAGAASIDDTWVSSGWQDSIEGSGTVTRGSGLLEGGDPGFVDPSGEDYTLSASAPGLDVGWGLAAGAASLPPSRQYVPHQQGEPRPDDGASDLGAFERAAR